MNSRQTIVLKIYGIIEYIFDSLSIEDNHRLEVRNNLLNTISLRIMSQIVDNPELEPLIKKIASSSQPNLKDILSVSRDFPLEKTLSETSIKVLTEFVSLDPTKSDQLSNTIGYVFTNKI